MEQSRPCLLSTQNVFGIVLAAYVYNYISCMCAPIVQCILKTTKPIIIHRALMLYFGSIGKHFEVSFGIYIVSPRQMVVYPLTVFGFY